MSFRTVTLLKQIKCCGKLKQYSVVYVTSTRFLEYIVLKISQLEINGQKFLVNYRWLINNYTVCLQPLIKL